MHVPVRSSSICLNEDINENFSLCLVCTAARFLDYFSNLKRNDLINFINSSKGTETFILINLSALKTQQPY